MADGNGSGNYDQITIRDRPFESLSGTRPDTHSTTARHRPSIRRSTRTSAITLRPRSVTARRRASLTRPYDSSSMTTPMTISSACGLVAAASEATRS